MRLRVHCDRRSHLIYYWPGESGSQSKHWLTAHSKSPSSSQPSECGVVQLSRTWGVNGWRGKDCFKIPLEQILLNRRRRHLRSITRKEKPTTAHCLKWWLLFDSQARPMKWTFIVLSVWLSTKRRLKAEDHSAFKNTRTLYCLSYYVLQAAAEIESVRGGGGCSVSVQLQFIYILINDARITLADEEQAVAVTGCLWIFSWASPVVVVVVVETQQSTLLLIFTEQQWSGVNIEIKGGRHLKRKICW